MALTLLVANEKFPKPKFTSSIYSNLENCLNFLMSKFYCLHHLTEVCVYIVN